MKTKSMSVSVGEMIDDLTREVGLVEKSTVEWLTSNDVCKELKIHSNTCYRMIHSGQLRAYSITVSENGKKCYRIKRSDLQEYLSARYCRW